MINPIFWRNRGKSNYIQEETIEKGTLTTDWISSATDRKISAYNWSKENTLTTNWISSATDRKISAYNWSKKTRLQLIEYQAQLIGKVTLTTDRKNRQMIEKVVLTTDRESHAYNWLFTLRSWNESQKTEKSPCTAKKSTPRLMKPNAKGKSCSAVSRDLVWSTFKRGTRRKDVNRIFRPLILHCDRQVNFTIRRTIHRSINPSI